MNAVRKFTGPPASEEKIQGLKSLLPRSTPPDYFSFLAKSNGAEMWFEESNHVEGEFDCIRLDTAEVITAYTEGWPTPQLANLVVIGSDAGSSLLAYDLSQPDCPLIFHSTGYGNTRIASSLEILVCECALFLQQ